MRTSSIIVLVLGLAAQMSGVHALGAAHVTHRCPYDVYCAKARGHTLGEKVDPSDVTTYTLLPYDTQFDVPFDQIGNSPGMSILCKKTATQDSNDSTQLEFELKDGKTWFDISNVMGQPFLHEGFSLHVNEPETAALDTCYGATCMPNDANCKEVYNASDDDKQAMRACTPEVDLHLYLCGPGPPQLHSFNRLART